MPKKCSPRTWIVGDITKVYLTLCNILLNNNYLPVFVPIGYEENTGNSLNINADTATGALAGALQAELFILVTDVAGVLNENKQLLPHLTFSQLTDLKINKLFMVE